MKKYLIIDKTSRLLLHAGEDANLVHWLSRSLDDVSVTSIDQSNAFWKNANKTVMANRYFTVDRDNVVTQSTRRFSEELVDKLTLCKAKEHILSNLMNMVIDWTKENNPLIFPGMESIVEVELRDCNREEDTYTARINQIGKAIGKTASETYDLLDAYAGQMENKKLLGLGFIYKYTGMIGSAGSLDEIDRVNDIMYKEWADQFATKEF